MAVVGLDPKKIYSVYKTLKLFIEPSSSFYIPLGANRAIWAKYVLSGATCGGGFINKIKKFSENDEILEKVTV